jgi:K+-transporting ATPase KdpF subunit
MTVENVVVGIICLAVMAYLFVALIRPEKF